MLEIRLLLFSNPNKSLTYFIIIFILFGFPKVFICCLNFPTKIQCQSFKVQTLFPNSQNIFLFLFQTLSVEFFHLDEKGATNDEMKTYMISQGYKYHSTVTAQKNHANDYIFVHKSV